MLADALGGIRLTVRTRAFETSRQIVPSSAAWLPSSVNCRAWQWCGLIPPMRHHGRPLSVGCSPLELDHLDRLRRFQLRHETVDPCLGLWNFLVELGNPAVVLLCVVLPAVENYVEYPFKAPRLQDVAFKMVRYQGIKLVHRRYHAGAARFSLTLLDRVDVIPVLSIFTSFEFHGAATLVAEADASQKRRTVHHSWRRDFGFSWFQVPLHCLGSLSVNQGRNSNRCNLAFLLHFFLRATVELILADIRLTSEDVV